MGRSAAAVALVMLAAASAFVIWRGRGPARMNGPDRPVAAGAPATGTGTQHIDAALDRLYPGLRDHRFGLRADPGETEPPLAQIVAYRAPRPVPHWHYITYGLSELGAKTSRDPALSGFGVEYTLRLVSDAAEPPPWPMNLLRWTAAAVRRTRQPFDHGHSADLPDGLLARVSPGVEGLGFIKDAELGTLQTPNGAVTFVNVLPLTGREHWLVGAWDFFRFAEVLQAQQGDLLWRIGRTSVLDGPRGAEVLARVQREGSSQSVDFVELAWNERELVLDRYTGKAMVKFLRHRLAHGREAAMVHGERRATLTAGPWRMQPAEKTLALSVPAGEAGALADAIEAAAHGAVVTRGGGVRIRLQLEEAGGSDGGAPGDR
jgi:hypothetical protein